MNTMKPIKELTVYRDLWVRGDNTQSALLNMHGMCCLGFACVAIGVPANALVRVGDPESTRGIDEIPGLTKRTLRGGPRQGLFVREAMLVNDNAAFPGAVRETVLQKLFAENNITLTFEDVAPDSLRKVYEDALRAHVQEDTK